MKAFYHQMVFHVSTLLPHNPDDCLHAAKKQHIGNDVVAIIFQVIVIGEWKRAGQSSRQAII